VVFPVSVYAATVVDIYDQPSSSQVSTASNHTFVFTAADTLNEGETILLTFPSGYVLTTLTEDDVDLADDGVDLTTSANCSGSEQASVTIVGQVITVTICAGDGGAMASGSVVTIEVGTNASASGSGTHRIVNPSAAASYFLNLSGTSGNSGSVVSVITASGGSSVSATVPASSSGGGGGGGGGGGTSDSDEPTNDPGEDPDPEPEDTPTEPEDPTGVLPEGDDPTHNEGGNSPSTDPAPDDGGSAGGSNPSSGPSTSSPANEDGNSANIPSVPDQGVISVPDEEGTVVPDETGSTSGGFVPDTGNPTSTTPTSTVPTVPISTTNGSTILEEIRAIPEVQAAVDIAVPLAAVTAVATTVVLISSFSLLPYLQWLVTSPFLLLGKRKRKTFGVVYNAITKVPIELATVRLYDIATGRLVRSAITDAKGAYSFVALPGQYRLAVAKSGFIFPSAYLQGMKDDGVFLDVYTSQPIEVTQEQASIAANIPLDPSDAAQFHAPRVLRFRKFLRSMQYGFSIFGVIASVAVAVLSPSPLAFLFVGIQVAVFLLFWRLAKPKRPRGWGIVFDAKSRKPVGNAVVRLFEPKYNKLVETAITDSLGRYNFLIGPNEYFVRYDKEGYQQSVVNPIDYRQKKEPEPLTVDVPLMPDTRL
jgi:hypothetical protein